MVCFHLLNHSEKINELEKEMEKSEDEIEGVRHRAIKENSPICFKQVISYFSQV